MPTSEKSVVNIHRTELKAKNPKCASMPIRIRAETKQKLDHLLALANKKKFGKKVKPNDLICYALDRINDGDIAQICENSLSNKDRLDLFFEQTKRSNRSLTREQFYGMLIEGSKVDVSN